MVRATRPPEAWGGNRLILRGNGADVADLEVIAEREDGFTRYISTWEVSALERAEIVMANGRIIVQQVVYEGALFNPIGVSVEGVMPE